MKRLMSLLLILCLLLPAAALGERVTLRFEDESYTLSPESVQVVDGALQIEVSGFGNAMHIRNGQIIIPFWVYVMSAGKKLGAISVQVDASGVNTYSFETASLPDEAFIYAQGDESNAVPLWKNTGENPPAPQEDVYSPASPEPYVARSDLADNLFIAMEIYADNDAMLRDALAYLREGNTIGEGEHSEHARALQFLLNALSPVRNRIAETGRVDAETLNTLRRIQRGLGMRERGEVDAEDFLHFLKACCCWMAEGKALAILMDEGMTKAEFHQFCGDVFTLKGWQDMATAQYAMIDAPEGEPGEAPSAAVSVPWPSTGVVYRNAEYPGKSVTLHVTIDSEESGHATLVKIYNSIEDLICCLFIGGVGTATVNLPAGTYTLKTGVGERYYGIEDAFGREGHYQTLLFDGGAEQVRLESGYEYNLTINTAMSDPDADDVGSEYENWEDF